LRLLCDRFLETGRSAWLWSYRKTFVSACGLFFLSAWITVTTITYLKTQSYWEQTLEDVEDLEQAYAALLTDTQNSQIAFLDEIENLENSGDQQLGTIHAMRTLRRTLLDQVQLQQKQLHEVTTQKETVQELISAFETSIGETENLLQTAAREKSSLKERLDDAQAQLTEISQERDASERVEMGLRWRLTKLEDELQARQAEGGGAEIWLQDWALGRAAALEDLFSHTGVDLEMLLARASEAELGQGGPFQLASTKGNGADRIDGFTQDIKKLAALQTLARSLPLGAPMDHYNITSSFGKRSDPITGELAFHGGLDFGASPNSKIRATAPGRVVHAGPLGPYGNTVEIDHGLGVTTRFGHMKEIEVKAGQDVQFRDVIGVIGSTGRSTGRHLHYEVRLDGNAYDPAKFLDTGRYLVWAFGNGRT